MKNAALWICSLAAAAGIAAASGDPAFERVWPDSYADMLHEADRSYDHKDYVRAFALNRRTACAGDETSQAILGRMYVLGQGTGRDDIAGYAWIKLAAESGYGRYTSLARKIEHAMTADQRSQANARAESMHRDYGLVATGMSCHGEARHGAYVIDAVICTPASDGVGQLLMRRCTDVAN